MSNANSFVKALKEAGVFIENESRLIREMDSSDDQNAAFERACTKFSSGGTVKFIADPSIDSKPVSKAFSDHNLDGFSFRTFAENLKPA